MLADFISRTPPSEMAEFFMFKVKKDTYRKQYEIVRDGQIVFTCPVHQLTDLTNSLVQYVVGKDYIISAPNVEARAKGYGKYHYFKGMLLAAWHDLKKKYGKASTGNTQSE